MLKLLSEYNLFDYKPEDVEKSMEDNSLDDQLHPQGLSYRRRMSTRTHKELEMVNQTLIRFSED